MGALLNATPRTLVRQVVSSSADIDAAAWGVLLVVAFLLFDLYAGATLMALFLIYGLSRAVNRLSRATEAVRAGDFSLRIPVRRKDQLGELQRSYNEMAGSLEELVTATAQKESLEKELQVARELQQSLLPSSLTTTEAVEMASYFEPSAAIGGDYFDLLKGDNGRLVVVVADVSGHGLSAGLRMAMLKAALVMLVEQGLPPQDVFARLNRLVREGQGNIGARPLVTATLASFDPRSGMLRAHQRRARPHLRAARTAGSRRSCCPAHRWGCWATATPHCRGQAGARRPGGLALRRPGRDGRRRRRALRLRQRAGRAGGRRHRGAGPRPPAGARGGPLERRAAGRRPHPGGAALPPPRILSFQQGGTAGGLGWAAPGTRVGTKRGCSFGYHGANAPPARRSSCCSSSPRPRRAPSWCCCRAATWSR